MRGREWNDFKRNFLFYFVKNILKKNYKFFHWFPEPWAVKSTWYLLNTLNWNISEQNDGVRRTGLRRRLKVNHNLLFVFIYSSNLIDRLDWLDWLNLSWFDWFDLLYWLDRLLDWFEIWFELIWLIWLIRFVW